MAFSFFWQNISQELLADYLINKDDLIRIEEAIKSIYSKKTYPDKNDYWPEHKNIRKICEDIIKEASISNYKLVESEDCPYAIIFYISISKDLPLLCNAKKEDYRMFYDFGELRILFSKIVPYAIFLWRVLKGRIISYSTYLYKPPNILWSPLLCKIMDILKRNNIKVLYEPYIHKKYNFKFYGKFYSTRKPTLKELLFAEND